MGDLQFHALPPDIGQLAGRGKSHPKHDIMKSHISDIITLATLHRDYLVWGQNSRLWVYFSIAFCPKSRASQPMSLMWWCHFWVTSLHCVLVVHRGVAVQCTRKNIAFGQKTLQQELFKYNSSNIYDKKSNKVFTKDAYTIPIPIFINDSMRFFQN